MACNSKENTIKALLDRGIISDTRRILNLGEFNRLNELYTNTAKQKYGIDTGDLLLFNKEDVESNDEKFLRASANQEFFTLIDAAINTPVDIQVPYQEASEPQTEVEKILKQSTTQGVLDFNITPVTELTTSTRKKAIEKVGKILDILKIKTQFASLDEDTAAQVDMFNRLIQFAEGYLTEDNFTEEAMHLVTEILEQKNKPLFDKLKSEIWKYQIYTDVLNEYSGDKAYQNEDGSRNIDKLKKEAIAQLLTAKVLSNEEIPDPKGFLSSVWDTVKHFVRGYILRSLPTDVRDEYTNFADRILETDFIEPSDAKYLESREVYKSRITNLQKQQGRARRLFASLKSNLREFGTSEDIYQYLLNRASTISKIAEMEVNPQTGENEEVEYYVSETGKKMRITSMISKSNENLYKNIDQSDLAVALREAKMQKGTLVHETIESIIARFVDPATGLIKEYVDDRPRTLPMNEKFYDTLEKSLINRLASYPEGTRFLSETPVVDEKAGLAGTVDFIAILPNGAIDILDWKTTDVTYKEGTTKKTRFDISPYNQAYWRTQLGLYKDALVSYGLTNFRQTRAIPILLETTVTRVDKTKPLDASNAITEIASLKIGDVDPLNIPLEEFTSIPVPDYFESTGNKDLDEVIKKLWGIHERIQNTTYSQNEKFKKRLELDKISAAIRELQVRKTAVLFTNIFNDAFRRYNQLSKEKLDFLDTINNETRFMSQEEEEQVNLHVSELYDGIEFLSAFEEYPQVIKEIYLQRGTPTPQEIKILQDITNIGSKGSGIRKELIKTASEVMTKLAKAYDIENVAALDMDSTNRLGLYLTSILHRKEKTIQYAARVINAMRFISKKESDKYFDPENGRFHQVYKSVSEWSKKNNIKAKDAYKKILDPDGRHLLSTIKDDFQEVMKNRRQELAKWFKIEHDRLFEQKYRGKNLSTVLLANYKAEVLPFLKENFDLAAYDAAYGAAFIARKEALAKSKFDEDDIIDQERRDRFLQEWIDEHDIYISPNALTHTNHLLALRDDVWQSAGYKELLKPANKPLLDMYNLFLDINKDAKDAGMLSDVYDAQRFLPVIGEKSRIKALKSTVNEIKETIEEQRALGAKITPWSYLTTARNVLSDVFIQSLKADREEEARSKDVDLLTKKTKQRRRVMYKSVQDGLFQSDEVFEAYALWANHIIKYKTVSNFEQRLKLIETIQNNKKDVFDVDSKGNIANLARPISKLKDPTVRSQTVKSGSTDDDLHKILAHYLYSDDFVAMPALKNVLDLLKSGAAVAYLGLNAKLGIVNIIGGTSSASLQKGGAFNSIDFEKAMASIVAFGVGDKLGLESQEKTHFLLETFQTRIESEHHAAMFAKYRGKWTSRRDPGSLGYIFLSAGDTWMQDAMGLAILRNTMVHDGKFVNINDYVKSKYKDERLKKGITKKELQAMDKKIAKEVADLKKSSAITEKLVKTETGYTIDGIDINTKIGQTQVLNLSNKIRSYSKTAIGNMDETDKFVGKMYWWSQYFTQLKNWMFRVYGSRIGGVETDYERGEITYGRYRAYGNALFSKHFVAMATESAKALLPLLGYVTPVSGVIGWSFSKVRQNTVMYNVDIIEAGRAKYFEEKEKAAKRELPFNIREDEFIDLYRNQVRATLHGIRQFATVGLAIALLLAAKGKSKDWKWYELASILFGLDRELGGDKSPQQLINLLGQTLIPLVSYLNEIVKFAGELSKEALGEAEVLVGDSHTKARGRKRIAKATPYDKFMKVVPIPGVRRLHIDMQAYSAKYAKFSKVHQPRVAL